MHNLGNGSQFYHWNQSKCTRGCCIVQCALTDFFLELTKPWAGSLNWEIIRQYTSCWSKLSVTALPDMVLPCSLWCSFAQQRGFVSSSIWSSHKQGQSRWRISVAFWRITTSRGGKRRFQIEKGLLVHWLMRILVVEVSPLHSVNQHYINTLHNMG